MALGVWAAFSRQTGRLEHSIAGEPPWLGITAMYSRSFEKTQALLLPAFNSWHASIQGGDGSAAELRVISALGGVSEVFTQEVVQKMPPAVGKTFEKAVRKTLLARLAVIKLLTKPQLATLLSQAVQNSRSIEATNLTLEIWFCSCPTYILLYMHADAVAAAEEMGIFTSACNLHRRLCTPPLSGEWWVSTSTEVNARSGLCGAITGLLTVVRNLSNEALRSSSSWAYIRQYAISTIKSCNSAGLYGMDNIVMNCGFFPASILERAASDVSQHAILIDADILDALENLSASDVEFGGLSASAPAAFWARPR